MSAVEAHDPGGSRRLPLQPGVTGEAAFSDCGRYRRWLSRRWGRTFLTGPYALWVGMNPSAAEGDVDDPTIRREIEFTRGLGGLTALYKVNVMDYRATKPARLLDPGVCPCSPDNWPAIRLLAEGADKIICAWGALPPRLSAYATAIESGLGVLDVELWCLGTTQAGHPRHPLYVKGTQPLVRYEPRDPIRGGAIT